MTRIWDVYRPAPAPPLRLWRTVQHRARVRRISAREAPDVVIGYDIYGAYAAGHRGAAGSGAVTVWHFHELWDPRAPSGRMTRRIGRYVHRHAREVDLVVHADAGRAALFAEWAGLERAPAVVPNCPRRLARLPENRLAGWLAERGISDRPALLYQGSIRRDRAVRCYVEAMALLPTEFVLVFVGPCYPPWQRELEALARSLGVGDRVLFTGRVPYERLFGYTVGAWAALTGVEPVDVNFQHSAGAVNKRYEAMACGLAQVSDDAPDVEALLAPAGLGLVAPIDSPPAVAEAVLALRDTPGLRQRLGANARKAHLERFHYERHFQPVLETLLSCARRGRLEVMA